MALSVEERIKKYHAWRKRESVERPMVGLLWEPDIPPLPAMLEQVGIGREITPDDVQPEMFLPHIECWYQQESRLFSDVIQPYTPAFGMPWVEAIAGCRVVGHPGSLWAEPALESYEGRPSIHFDPDNPWLRKLVAFTQVLVEFSDGRFPIALPQMRGPLDTLAALRTANRMCLDLMDVPDEVHQILDELTDLWISVADAVLEVIPPFYGGYSTRMKMWAPGKAITPQNDISTLISPRMYERFVLPRDRRIFEHFPYHSFHMHSTEHRHIDALLTVEDLTALQLTLEQDVGGPPLDTMLAAVRRVLAEKPLLLVPLDIQTAEICLETLPPEGLCVMLGLSDPEIPPRCAQWLEGRFLSV
jgi:hypothetical protein